MLISFCCIWQATKLAYLGYAIPHCTVFCIQRNGSIQTFCTKKPSAYVSHVYHGLYIINKRDFFGKELSAAEQHNII